MPRGVPRQKSVFVAPLFDGSIGLIIRLTPEILGKLETVMSGSEGLVE